MNQDRLRYPDPFATLVELTVGALRMPAEKPAAPARPRSAPPPRSLLDRLDAWLWHQRQKDIERSLADCQDVFEVERRLQGEQQLFRRYT
jgi:hypothetical protein